MRFQRLFALLTVINLALLLVLVVGGMPNVALEAVGADAAPPSVLRAQAIELVDSAGNVRGQLFLGPDGGGNIRLRAPNGEVRVKIGATLEGGGLMFADANTDPAVQLRAGGASGASLRLAGRDQKERVIAP